MLLRNGGTTIQNSNEKLQSVCEDLKKILSIPFVIVLVIFQVKNQFQYFGLRQLIPKVKVCCCCGCGLN